MRVRQTYALLSASDYAVLSLFLSYSFENSIVGSHVRQPMSNLTAIRLFICYDSVERFYGVPISYQISVDVTES